MHLAFRAVNINHNRAIIGHDVGVTYLNYAAEKLVAINEIMFFLLITDLFIKIRLRWGKMMIKKYQGDAFYGAISTL